MTSRKFDCVVIGAGHNGLIAAAYLARAGKKVAILERRQVIGGCSVTEALWPGYKVSTASYVVSLLLPEVIEELKLKQNGFADSAQESLILHPNGRRSAFASRAGYGVQPRADREV